MKIGKAVGIAICVLCVPVIQGCIGVAAVGLGTGAAVAQDRRTPGSYIDDGLIEQKVRATIRGEDILRDRSHVNVTSFNGLVLLTGQAPGESLRDRITEIARVIPKVRAVQNEISLGAPSSIASRTSDSWITAKVKAAMFTDKAFNATHVKVVTENGVVYLMGLLKQNEAEQAAEIARRVGGVQRVVKVMEYIE